MMRLGILVDLSEEHNDILTSQAKTYLWQGGSLAQGLEVFPGVAPARQLCVVAGAHARLPELLCRVQELCYGCRNQRLPVVSLLGRGRPLGAQRGHLHASAAMSLVALLPVS